MILVHIRVGSTAKDTSNTCRANVCFSKRPKNGGIICRYFLSGLGSKTIKLRSWSCCKFSSQMCSQQWSFRYRQTSRASGQPSESLAIVLGMHRLNPWSLRRDGSIGCDPGSIPGRVVFSFPLLKQRKMHARRSFFKLRDAADCTIFHAAWSVYGFAWEVSACLKIFEETRRPELQNKRRLEKKFCHGAENESFNFQCKKNKMHVFSVFWTRFGCSDRHSVSFGVLFSIQDKKKHARFHSSLRSTSYLSMVPRTRRKHAV